jgi:hypothetical protein
MAGLETTPYEELVQVVCGLLDDFGRQVRQAHSLDEVEAHRDEVATLIVAIARAADQTARRRAPRRPGSAPFA